MAAGAALLAVPGPVTGEGPAVSLALVIDTSGSLRRPDLAQARELALGVLAALPAGSEAAVFSFDDQSRLLQARTTDADAVRRAVDSLRTSGRHTALHDALYDASRYLSDVPGKRRAILLVTDGRDERSAVNLEDGLAVALKAQIPVFCVGVGRVEEGVLRRIAKLTSGRYLPGAEAEPSVIATRILEAPEVRTEAALPAVTTPSPPAAAPSAAPLPPPPRAPVSPLVWAGAGLVLLAIAGALALRATARRRSAVPASHSSGPSLLDTGQAEASPGTMFARLDVSREGLAKTQLLREKPVLAVTTGARTGEVFPLSRASAISVGRARANDIVLEDVAVSSQHCRIRPEQDRFVVHDLDSTNGTRVNDRRVKRHVLAEGDVIQIGETRLEFRMEQSRAERF